jgi:outer membrane protein
MLPLVVSFLLQAAPAVPPPLVDAIRAGEKHSHPLAITRANADIASAQQEAALSGLIPFLNVQGGYTRNQFITEIQVSNASGGPPQTIVIQPYNLFIGTLTVQMQLVDIPAIERYLGSRHGTEAGATRVQASRRDVQLAIAQVYYQVVAAQGTVTAAERALDTARKNEQSVEIRFQQGTAPKLTFDKAKVDTAAASTNLINAQRALELARRRFSTLTGLPEPQQLPDPADQPAPAFDEDALVKTALDQRPEVVAAKQSIEQAESGKSQAWTGALPTLTGNFQEHLTNAAGFVGRNPYWTAGLTLNWTVDPLLTSANMHQADANAVIAQQQLDAQIETVRDDVHSALLNVNSNRARLSQASAQAENAHEALQLTEIKLQEGVATSLEVSQAQADAFTADATLAQAKADFAYSLLEVQHSVGELIVAD